MMSCQWKYFSRLMSVVKNMLFLWSHGKNIEILYYVDEFKTMWIIVRAIKVVDVEHEFCMVKFDLAQKLWKCHLVKGFVDDVWSLLCCLALGSRFCMH